MTTTWGSRIIIAKLIIVCLQSLTLISQTLEYVLIKSNIIEEKILLMGFKMSSERSTKSHNRLEYF